ncbi:hypothetical protein [Flexivirga alba]|uniref:Uncharacterized protein n=1 Tax=Flexivirga alba TaxID=702742 RepID=A0ABW2AL59_9MICO
MNPILVLDVIALPVMVWVLIEIVVPSVARARFLAEMTALRDSVSDDVLATALPSDDPDVASFQRLTQACLANPRALSMSLLLAFHETVERDGTRPRVQGQGDAGLWPSERERMWKYRLEFSSITAKYVRRSSSAWIPLHLLLWVVAVKWEESRRADG